MLHHPTHSLCLPLRSIPPRGLSPLLLRLLRPLLRLERRDPLLLCVRPLWLRPLLLLLRPLGLGLAGPLLRVGVRLRLRQLSVLRRVLRVRLLRHRLLRRGLLRLVLLLRMRRVLLLLILL
jgi:hypothetical protein